MENGHGPSIFQFYLLFVGVPLDYCPFIEDHSGRVLAALDAPPVNGTNDFGEGEPWNDVIIGFTPFHNDSIWNDGDPCAYIPVSFVRKWIEDVILEEVIQCVVANIVVF